MLDLKAFAGDRYRITLDPSAEDDTDHESKLWCYRIPGRTLGEHSSFVSVHAADTLAAWSDRPSIVRKLASLDGCRVHQRGDHEIRVLFPPGRLDEVCAIIEAKRRRRMTAEQREAARDRLAPWRFEKARTSAS
jgi:hypothetical protein